MKKILLIMGMFLMLIPLVTAQLLLTDGVQGYISFDNGFDDTSPNFLFTDPNTAGVTINSVNTKVGNGSGDFAGGTTDILWWGENNTVFNINNNWSISGWYFADVLAGNNAFISSRLISTGATRNEMLFRGADSNAFRFFSNAGGLANASTSLMNTASWHNWIITYNDQVFKYYLNGTQVGGEGSLLHDPWNDLTNLSLAFVETYDGQMDEILIWNRSLSAVEVLAVFNNGSQNIPFPWVPSKQPPNITLLNITSEPLFNASPVDYELQFIDIDSSQVNMTMNISIDQVLFDQKFKTFNVTFETQIFFEDFEENNTDAWSTVGTVADFSITDTENISGSLSAIVDTGALGNRGGIIRNLTSLNLQDGVYELSYVIFIRSGTVLNVFNFMSMSNNSDHLNSDNANGVTFDDSATVSQKGDTSVRMGSFNVGGGTGFFNISIRMNMVNGTINGTYFGDAAGSNSSTTWDSIDNLNFVKLIDLAGGDEMDLILDDIRLVRLGQGIINVTDLDTFTGNWTPGQNVTLNVSLFDGENESFAGFLAIVETNFTLSLSNISISPSIPDNDDIINSSSILNSSNQDVDVSVSWFINNISVNNDTFLFVFNGDNVTSGINCATLGCNGGDNVSVDYTAINGFLTDFKTISFTLETVVINITGNVSIFTITDVVCVKFQPGCFDGVNKCQVINDSRFQGDFSLFDESCSDFQLRDSALLMGLLFFFGLAFTLLGYIFKIPVFAVVGVFLWLFLSITLFAAYPLLAIVLVLITLIITVVIVFQMM